MGAAVLAFGLTACAGTGTLPPAPSQDGPITTEAEYRARIVGRNLRTGPDEITRHSSDRSWLTRRANHIVAAGVWDWQGTRWCREGRIAGRMVPQTCHALETVGDRLQLVGADGSMVEAIIVPAPAR